MESQKLSAASGGEGTGRVPLTWDHRTPPPDATGLEEPTATGTERTPSFDMAELVDFEEESDGLQTVVTTSAYELRPRFTGRGGTMSKLAELVARAYEKRELAFAIVVGEPGAGKSRLLSELVARTRTRFAR